VRVAHTGQDRQLRLQLQLVPLQTSRAALAIPFLLFVEGLDRHRVAVQIALVHTAAPTPSDTVLAAEAIGSYLQFTNRDLIEP
jgi:hypothetical protein